MIKEGSQAKELACSKAQKSEAVWHVQINKWDPVGPREKEDASRRRGDCGDYSSDDTDGGCISPVSILEYFPKEKRNHSVILKRREIHFIRVVWLKYWIRSS